MAVKRASSLLLALVLMLSLTAMAPGVYGLMTIRKNVPIIIMALI